MVMASMAPRCKAGPDCEHPAVFPLLLALLPRHPSSTDRLRFLSTVAIKRKIFHHHPLTADFYKAFRIDLGEDDSHASLSSVASAHWLQVQRAIHSRLRNLKLEQDFTYKWLRVYKAG